MVTVGCGLDDSQSLVYLGLHGQSVSPPVEGKGVSTICDTREQFITVERRFKSFITHSSTPYF